jgi:hypothetical protein
MTEQQNELNEINKPEPEEATEAAAEPSTAPAELDKTVEQNKPAEPAKKPEPNQPLTPFQAAKRVNDALKAAGLNKKIQAPMMYMYASKDKFVTRHVTKVTAKGIEKDVLEVDEESFFAWMEQYVAGAVARANGTSPTQTADEIDVAEGHESDGATTDEVEEVTEAE